MVATLFLFGCVLVPAQPAERSEWLLAPQLSRAQELVYRGAYGEEALGNGVLCQRGYRLEHRVFVLDKAERGAEVALFTVLRPKTNPEGAQEPVVNSLRLELAKVDAQGRLTADGKATLAVPLDGPPTLECGCFVEAPARRVGVGQAWEVAEDGRPARAWKAAGTERVLGTTCVKVVGVQQSDDWDRPRADRAAWRRQDTLWVAPSSGVAQKVERVVERRDAGRSEPTFRTVVSYDLVSTVQYPAQLYDDRRLDITQAHGFHEAAQPLLASPARHAAKIDALLGRISYHLQKPSPTPYRDAAARLKGRLEAARRGEAVVQIEEPPPLPTTAAVGKPAPDFVVPDFQSADSARLKRWAGKPVVLVFYSPSSPRAAELLGFCQGLAAQFGRQAQVVGLAMSEDGERVRKQGKELRLTFPLLNGTGLRLSYAVEATPKLVVLDADGVVRGSGVGWGVEVQDSVEAELRRCLPKRENEGKK